MRVCSRNWKCVPEVAKPGIEDGMESGGVHSDYHNKGAVVVV